ncbi:hypothetical protein D3C86_2263410 [compost metagenome]
MIRHIGRIMIAAATNTGFRVVSFGLKELIYLAMSSAVPNFASSEGCKRKEPIGIQA